jgi:hypothetical protein
MFMGLLRVAAWGRRSKDGICERADRLWAASPSVRRNGNESGGWDGISDTRLMKRAPRRNLARRKTRENQGKTTPNAILSTKNDGCKVLRKNAGKCGSPHTIWVDYPKLPKRESSARPGVTVAIKRVDFWGFDDEGEQEL